MSIKLYVGNLSFNTTGEDLREYFSQAGTVESASVVEFFAIALVLYYKLAR